MESNAVVFEPQVELQVLRRVLDVYEIVQEVSDSARLHLEVSFCLLRDMLMGRGEWTHWAGAPFHDPVETQGIGYAS